MDEDDRNSSTQSVVIKRSDKDHKKRMKASQARRRDAELNEASITLTSLNTAHSIIQNKNTAINLLNEYFPFQVVELLSSNILEGYEDGVDNLSALFRPIVKIQE